MNQSTLTGKPTTVVFNPTAHDIVSMSMSISMSVKQASPLHVCYIIQVSELQATKAGWRPGNLKRGNGRPFTVMVLRGTSNYKQTSVFLCFHKRKPHQSTCSHVFSPFSAHFYPTLHHNGKGSIEHY